jgi:hypothetical protein
MGLVGPEFESARTFAGLAMSNLTMSESCKEDLLLELGLQFFLNFPRNITAQRTSALCLSELFEEEKNQQQVFSGGQDLTKSLLETLLRMAASRDPLTHFLAVKSLSLLANHPHNIPRLLCNGVLEIFSSSLKTDGEQGYAWDGLRAMAKDKTQLLRYAEAGPDMSLVVVDDIKDNCPERYTVSVAPGRGFPTIRINIPLKTVCQVYYECTTTTGGILQLGLAELGWEPANDSSGVGDDSRSYGVDGARRCGWHSGEVTPPTSFSWSPNSTIGILIDLNQNQSLQCVKFTVDGVDSGLQLNSTSNWIFGIFAACSFVSGESAVFNIGATPFIYDPPSGFVSLIHYARAHHIEIPKTLEVWSNNSWSAITAEDNLMELERVSIRARKRVHSVAWLLFVETISLTDNFFTKPLLLESEHPNSAPSTTQYIIRPGASAFEMNFDKIKFSKALGANESIQIYTDKDAKFHIKRISGNDSYGEPFLALSDRLLFHWNSDKHGSNSHTSPGWGYKISLTPKYGRVDLPNDKAIEGFSVFEESEHNYADNLDTTHQVSLPGAEAIKIVFDPQSHTESNCDYLTFFLDSECTIPAPGVGSLSGTSFPGTGDVPPLVIEASEFWYRFHSDGSQNFWGYRFECSPALPKIKEYMQKPGAVRFSTAHPYAPAHACAYEKVSVNGRYHAALYFSPQSELSPGDSLDFYVSNPLTEGSTPIMTLRDKFPLDLIHVPAATFWIAFNSTNGGNHFGYDFVAFRSFDSFTAAAYSVGAVVIETPHPYPNSMDEKYAIDVSQFPESEGVRRVAVAFDPRSSTEANYDYLEFLSRLSEGSNYGESKYSGGRGGTLLC